MKNARRGGVFGGCPRIRTGAPTEHSALQAGAANRMRLPPGLSYSKSLAESLGIEPKSRPGAWRFSNVLPYRLPRSPWHSGEDSNPMRRVWNPPALPGAPEQKCWRRSGESNPSAPKQRQFSRLLGGHLAHLLRFKNLVAPERVELSRPKALVSKTSASSNFATGPLGASSQTRTG